VAQLVLPSTTYQDLARSPSLTDVHASATAAADGSPRNYPRPDGVHTPPHTCSDYVISGPSRPDAAPPEPTRSSSSALFILAYAYFSSLRRPSALSNALPGPSPGVVALLLTLKRDIDYETVPTYKRNTSSTIYSASH
jgi:hypothetical protein